MAIPTRPATDHDIPTEWNGVPDKVLVGFFYALSPIRYIGNGWRRPKKRTGVWMVRKWGYKPLLVRTDEDHLGRPSFVVSP